METTDRSRLNTNGQVDENNTRYSDDRHDSLPAACSGHSSPTLNDSFSDVASTSASIEKDEWVDDDYPSFQPLGNPLRSLANTHMAPPNDIGDDWDEQEDFDEEQLVEAESDEYDLDIDAEFDCSILSAVGVSGKPADKADTNLSVGHEFSSVNGAHNQNSLQGIPFPADAARIPNARDSTRESGYPKPAQLLRQREKERGEEAIIPGKNGDDSGDFVIIQEEADENDYDEGLTDSCFNLIRHLDYVMFPTVDVLETVHGGEEQVQGIDTKRKQVPDWSFLASTHGQELENWGRKWFTCGVDSATPPTK